MGSLARTVRVSTGTGPTKIGQEDCQTVIQGEQSVSFNAVEE